jgi:hypothetical protein
MRCVTKRNVDDQLPEAVLVLDEFAAFHSLSERSERSDGEM